MHDVVLAEDFSGQVANKRGVATYGERQLLKQARGGNGLLLVGGGDCFLDAETYTFSGRGEWLAIQKTRLTELLVQFRGLLPTTTTIISASTQYNSRTQTTESGASSGKRYPLF